MTQRAEFHPLGRWLPVPSLTLAALLLLFAVSSAMAIEPAQVPDHKRSATGLHLTAVEAAAMKRAAPAKVLLIDVRTRAEAMHAGHANPCGPFGASAGLPRQVGVEPRPG